MAPVVGVTLMAMVWCCDPSSVEWVVWYGGDGMACALQSHGVQLYREGVVPSSRGERRNQLVRPERDKVMVGPAGQTRKK